VKSTSDATEVVTIGEVVKVGADIKAKLELLARRENADAAWLARRILRDWLERRSAAATEPPRARYWSEREAGAVSD
jgi:hypothetical protein